MEEEIYRKIREIISDKVHGSTQIASRLLEFLSEALTHIEESQVHGVLHEVLNIVKERSSIILPANLMYVLEKTVDSSFKLTGRVNFRMITEKIFKLYVRDLVRVVENAVEALKDYRKIFTLSYSSQVLNTLKKLRDVEVFMITGWPLFDGVRAFKELSSQGLRAKVYPDSSIIEAINYSEAVILGCDAILTDGSMVNRSGSKLAGLICNEKSTPLYVVCDSMKLDFQHLWRPEVWSYNLEDIYMDFNVFEIVEPNLITEYISELGRDAPADFVEKALRKIEDYPMMLISW